MARIQLTAALKIDSPKKTAMNVANSMLLLLILIAFVPLTAHAQTTFGTVLGIVTDPSGAVVAGATVTLKSDATGQTHTMKTTSGGNYSFVNLDPGTYSLTIEQTGFQNLQQRGIVVQVASTTRADVALKLGNASTQVVVTSAPPLLQTDTASLGSVIEQRTIKNIPLSGRNVNNLLTLVPGVVAQGSTYGNPSTNPIALGTC